MWSSSEPGGNGSLRFSDDSRGEESEFRDRHWLLVWRYRFPLSRGWRHSLSKQVQTQRELASICCCLCFCGHYGSLALWWEKTFWPDNELLLPGWVMEVRLRIQTELSAGREGMRNWNWEWNSGFDMDCCRTWAGHARASFSLQDHSLADKS